MVTGRSRKPESYASEDRYFHGAAAVVEAAGFVNVAARKSGSVKIIDALCHDGARASFWLKVGWSYPSYAAVQLGMLPKRDGASPPDAEYVQFVEAKVNSMKERGVSHALLVHRDVLAVALRIDDVPTVYREQMRLYPSSARNGASPTLWFYDSRSVAKTDLVAVALHHAIPLEALARRGDARPEDPDVARGIAEIETRLMQQVFRERVGDRCGWRCAVTGSVLREVLDAAHLPGTTWRLHNESSDGVLLRADIHRLLDSKLALIEDGTFVVEPAARSEYGQYHGARLKIA